MNRRLEATTMDPDYLPFRPAPSRPRFQVPPGAVDADCHVFGPDAAFPYAPQRKYTPCDAPKEKLFELRDFLGLEKNVIVQASCHGKDNAALIDGLLFTPGESVVYGGLLGEAYVQPVSRFRADDFVRLGGRIPAPLTALRN